MAACYETHAAEEEADTVCDTQHFEMSRSVDLLQPFGVSEGDIKKLKEHNFHTIEAVARTNRRLLVTLKGLCEKKIDKIQQEAFKFVHMGFEAAASVMPCRLNNIKIASGCREVDLILEGGFEAGSITEIYGEGGSGKSQICHMLCVMCQHPVSMGGAEGKAMYIDTEGTFRPERISEIADRFGLTQETALENVAFARAHNVAHQLSLLHDAAGLMSDSHYGLLVVDSATALYRTEFNGRGELSERQCHLGKFLDRLQKLAEEFNVAVVIANQVVANVGGGSAMFSSGPSFVPIGGNIMAHASATRIELRKKGRSCNRRLKIVSSPLLPERDAEFSIGPRGIDSAV